MTTPADTLAAELAGIALLRGTFTLRSGRTSSYYLDKYRFTTRPELLQKIAARFASQIASFAEINRLAGAELGGVPLVTAAGLETNLPFVLVRNAKKDYGTAQQLEGVLEKGDRVVLLEDVVTSGGQAVEAVEVLRAAGADVVAVLAVVDRQEGGAETIRAAGVEFEALFTKTDLGVQEEATSPK